MVRASACHAESCEFESRPDREIKEWGNQKWFPFFIMWKVYIIYSSKIDRYYVGITEDLNCRLERHNKGWGKYTKRGIPWKIVYSETFSDKSTALKREKEIKNKKNRKYIESLIRDN